MTRLSFLLRALLVVNIVFFSFQPVKAQFIMDMIDTTKDLGQGLLSIYRKFDHLRIGGYIQPQFQLATSKGASSFIGGDFPEHVNNRFLLRRGRLRVEYAKFNEANKPTVHFVFQFDGTERGVFIRDFWGRVFENKWEAFSFTGGMFARPFGYEVNLSSQDRESPERGRMSQILMKTERDLGAMVSFEPRNRKNLWRQLKIDAGLFNGQGLTSPGDFDSYKDFIMRAGLKPLRLSKKFLASAAVSYLRGGFLQNNKQVFHAYQIPILLDSSISNVGKKAPRIYHGADLQLKWNHSWGSSEFRAEYWWGTQTSTANNTETPTSLLTEPYYRRKFNGAFLYFLQNIANTHHQIGVKYDWYDPNDVISGKEIGTRVGFTPADIKYSTLGIGYLNYINENLKLVLWYDIVRNEITNHPEFSRDLKDNVFTCRMQFRF